jgi:hypothetical protein
MGPRVNYQSLGASPRGFLQAPNSFPKSFYRLLGANSQQLPGLVRVVVERKILKNLSEGVGSLEQFLLAGVWVSWVLPAGLFPFGKFGHL